MDLDLTGGPRPNKAPPIFGTCILCEEHKALARSHVVSDWMRARLFDNTAKQGNGFRFRHLDGDSVHIGEGLTTLPLMCTGCDNKFGRIEGHAASALLGNYSLTKFPESNPLIGAIEHSVNLTDGDFGIELPLWIPQGTRHSSDKALLRFGVLTGWRALHAVAREKANPAVTSFLDSPEGRRLNLLTRNMLLDETYAPELFEFGAFMTGFAPSVGNWITGIKDELPADCWAYVDAGAGQKAMAVMFGIWLIIWPMTDPAKQNIGNLEKDIWQDWVRKFLQPRFAALAGHKAFTQPKE
jgi:hypothetical protein